MGTASCRDLGKEGGGTGLLQICEDIGAEMVVVTGGEMTTQGEGLLQQTIQCLQRGIQVSNVSSFVEDAFQKVPVELVSPEWLVGANLHTVRPYLSVVKRGLDVLAAGIGLAVTAPLWPLFAALVKLSGPGEVFYKQMRTGLFGRPFTMYKFRTMRQDAEADGRAQWAVEKDPRVTLVGKVFRKSRIDEIPQLWNILKGEMSFVGPRPERPEFVEELSGKIPCYTWRHLSRPGLTGWAQIEFRYGASEEDAREKLRYDLYYVKHVSLLFDVYIFLRTMSAILKGAR